MTPKIVAKRPGQWLVRTSETGGYILDRRGAHPPELLSTILAHGYWEPSRDDLASVQTALDRKRTAR